MVAEHRPTLRTVSIMPGIEERAPDRTETKSGSFGSPKDVPMVSSTVAMAASTSASMVPGKVWSWS